MNLDFLIVLTCRWLILDGGTQVAQTTTSTHGPLVAPRAAHMLMALWKLGFSKSTLAQVKSGRYLNPDL